MPSSSTSRVAKTAQKIPKNPLVLARLEKLNLRRVVIFKSDKYSSAVCRRKGRPKDGRCVVAVVCGCDRVVGGTSCRARCSKSTVYLRVAIDRLGIRPNAAPSLGKPLRDGSALFVLSQLVTFHRTFLIFNILTSPITFIVTQLVVSMIIDLEAYFATFFLSNFQLHFLIAFLIPLLITFLL